MRLAAIGAAVLVYSAGGMAAAPAEQPPAPEAQQEPERKICRTERATGSLTRRTRVCLTQSQWRELHSRTKKGLDDFVGGASGGCRAPPNPMAGTMCGG
jgi:hypothetical protein